MTPTPRSETRDSTTDPIALQHTLNRALGSIGGRQKPWMVPNQPATPGSYPPFPTDSNVPHPPRPTHQLSASAQVPAPATGVSMVNHVPQAPVLKRKRGRPRKSSHPSDAHPEQAPQTIAAAQLSREQARPPHLTSPQLANLVSNAQGPAASGALPSPSPSPDTAPENLVSDSNRVFVPTSQHNDYAHASNATVQGVTARNFTSDLAFVSHLQHAASANKRPLETTYIPTDKRSRHQAIPQGPTVALHSHMQFTNQRRASNGQAQALSPRIGQARSLSLEQPSFNYPSPHLVHQSMTKHAQAGKTPPQAQVPFGPPRALSISAGQQPYVLPKNLAGGVRIHSPTVSSPLVPAEYFTRQDCIQKLKQYTTMHGDPSMDLNDGKRMRVLMEAVDMQDWDYLTMHQYYCLLNSGHERVSLQLSSHPCRNVAMELMNRVLESNETLSPIARTFFLTFPLPMDQIALNWPRMYQQQEQKFLHFMARSVYYEELVRICCVRRYPPIVRELHQTLGITSPIFQRIVFTAILRRVCAPSTSPPNFEHDAIAVFRQNQDHFSHQSNSNVPSSNTENEDKLWHVQLRHLCQAREKWRKSLLRPSPHQQQAHPQPQHPAIHAAQVQNAQIPIPGRRVRAQAHGIGQLQPILPTQLALPAQPRLPNPRGGASPFFPERGYTQPQQRVPDPYRFGLHLVHLRSPVLRAQSAGSELYQYFKAFAKAPMRLTDARKKIAEWKFRIDNLSSIPSDILGSKGQRPLRVVNEKSNVFRLRCIKWPTSKPDNINEHEWATADTSWPPSTYLTFNGTHLQQRKKLYHGKDLPIDISPLVKEGENKLEIAVVRQPTDERFLDYLLAIEVVGFQSHEAIKRNCLTRNHITAAETLQKIKRKLSAGASDDDEISIVESDLTISMFDPFSADRLCAIPARSKACLHIDCFDLETYLQTRERKGDVTVPDLWRCPICKLDARPQHLIVDGFIEDVQKSLAENGLLNTRTIIVDEHGNWKPKEEPAPTGEPDRSSPDDDLHPLAVLTNQGLPTPQIHKGHIEIIDLSD